jgi:hypothetical protein
MSHNYDKLQVYQRSIAVSVEIMKIIDSVRPFRLAEQIISSSISIPSSIAEGSERGLESEFGDSTNSLRIELNKLDSIGLLESSIGGNKKLFIANVKHPLFP